MAKYGVVAVAAWALLAAFVWTKVQAAQEEIAAPTVVSQDEWINAIQALRQSRLRLNQQRFVRQPLQRRFLEDDIQLLEAEIAVLATRVENYRPMRSFGELSPSYTAELNDRLALLAAQQDLARLRDQRSAVLRLQREEIALQKFDVLRDAVRLRELARARR